MVTQHSDKGWNRTGINPFITHPIKGCTTPPGSMPLIFYEQQCRFFYIFQETEQWKSYEIEPTVFRPCPRRLECLTICRCHIKGSTFSSVILRPWVLVKLEFEPTTSRSADQCLSNWANRWRQNNNNNNNIIIIIEIPEEIETHSSFTSYMCTSVGLWANRKQNFC